MQVEARMGVEPGTNGGRVVGVIVVDDQMKLVGRGQLSMEPLQKPKKLLRPMARHTLGDDRSVEDVQRGEERGRPVPLVVVRQRSRPALLHRQARLRPVERLNLALLVDAEHQAVFGGIQVEAHHIAHLLVELRVSTELKRAHQMRFQAVRMPDALHRGRANPLRVRHRSHAPLGCPLGPFLEGGVYNRPDLGLRQRRLTSTARPIPLERGESLARKPIAPAQHRRARQTQLVRDRVVGDTVGGTQHDLAPSHQALLSRGQQHPRLQLPALGSSNV